MPRKRTKPGPKPFRGRTMTTRSLVLPRSTWAFLDAQAAERGISRSNLVRTVILEWEEKRKAEEVRDAILRLHLKAPPSLTGLGKRPATDA